jgi:hypothetical protein
MTSTGFIWAGGLQKIGGGDEWFPNMSSNLATSVLDQATDQSTLTNRTLLLEPDFMHWVLLIGIILPLIF